MESKILDNVLKDDFSEFKRQIENELAKRVKNHPIVKEKYEQIDKLKKLSKDLEEV